MDVAIQLIRLSGLEPHEDIKIKITGLRPGEKLHEELFEESEERLPTHNPKIAIAKMNYTGNNNLLASVEELLSKLYSLSADEVKGALRELVPGYL